MKGALSGLTPFLATECPFKMMKNAFYLVLGELPRGKFPFVKLPRGELPRGIFPRGKLPRGKFPCIY